MVFMNNSFYAGEWSNVKGSLYSRLGMFVIKEYEMRQVLRK